MSTRYVNFAAEKRIRRNGSSWRRAYRTLDEGIRGGAYYEFRAWRGVALAVGLGVLFWVAVIVAMVFLFPGCSGNPSPPPPPPDSPVIYLKEHDPPFDAHTKVYYHNRVKDKLFIFAGRELNDMAHLAFTRALAEIEEHYPNHPRRRPMWSPSGGMHVGIYSVGDWCTCTDCGSFQGDYWVHVYDVGQGEHWTRQQWKTAVTNCMQMETQKNRCYAMNLTPRECKVYPRREQERDLGLALVAVMAQP